MMFDWLRGMFKSKVIYKVVEVKAPRPSYRWDQNTKDAVSTLAAHPGFVALTERLALAKAQLESTIKQTRHKTVGDVEFLQSGVFWSEWLQDQVAKATTKGSVKSYLDPYEEELAAFKELDARIERVGME